MRQPPLRSESNRESEVLGRLTDCESGCPEYVLSSMRRLDALLTQAVGTTAEVSKGEPPDPFQGLHITVSELNGLLAQEPGSPLSLGDVEIKHNFGRDLFSLLSLEDELCDFDIEVLILALAPELDLRYERIYAYIQNDVTRKRPTVDLALNLFCRTASEKIDRRSRFSPEAPLIRQGILRLSPEARETPPPLLAHYLKLDDQIVLWLLGQRTIDSRLTSFARFVRSVREIEELALDARTRFELRVLTRDALVTGRPLRLYLHGPQGSGAHLVADAIAREASLPLLIVDVPRLLANAEESEQALMLAFREARLARAVLHLQWVDELPRQGHQILYQALLGMLVEARGITLLSGREPWQASRDCYDGKALGIISIALTVPQAPQRLLLWKGAVASAGITCSSDQLHALADRFTMSAAQIGEAVASVARRRCIGGGDSERAAPNDLFLAARQQSNSILPALAQRIEPRKRLSDIVLPPDCLDQLKEVCDQVRFRSLVYDEWGFGCEMSLGKDLTVLFSGSSGTGKTMAAEAIATELGLDLYKIDLARVVSKYIGETEKNLDRIFTAAEGSNAILFFDEADALFGKRSRVRDAHDRYANIEVGYLLQKMEEHDGLTILATNMRANMDDAFIRRLKFHVEFPFPDQSCRRRIWLQHLPSKTPRDDDIDFDVLAQRFNLAGGNIRNIVLNASFLAAADGQVVRMLHLMRAAKREFQKMGKTCSEAEFQSYSSSMGDR
jgi:SpoVK/Ycf46/Vps4 family AAA+-type ATPase